MVDICNNRGVLNTKEKTMRVSELQVGEGHLVENANCDSYADFRNDYTKKNFIEANGDVEVVQQTLRWGSRIWNVPAFAEGRKAHNEYKAKVIAKWGTN